MVETPAEVTKDVADGECPPADAPASAGPVAPAVTPAAFPPPAQSAAPNPAARPAPPPPSSAAPARRRVRWLDASITLVLAVTVAGVATVAAPPLFRATGLVAPPARVTPVRVRQPARVPPSFFHEEADSDSDDSVEDMWRVPSLPGLHGGPDPLDPKGSDDPPRAKADDDRVPDRDPLRSGRDGRPAVRVGLTRHGLTLRERPGEGTEITGAVKAGEVVMIMKDAGEWVLIMHSGDDDVSMGWAKRSDVAIR